jgi:hypothetical protein
MISKLTYGEYSKSLITNIPADLSSETALRYKKTIPRVSRGGGLSLFFQG